MSARRFWVGMSELDQPKSYFAIRARRFAEAVEQDMPKHPCYVTKVKGTRVAKKKDKKKAKKAENGAKLPKRIAGVKVPKELRAGGGKVAELLRNPVVMDVAAAALLAAAAGLREGRSKPGTEGAGAKSPASDLGALLALKAVEGVRKLAANSNGGGTPGPKAPRGSS